VYVSRNLKRSPVVLEAYLSGAAILGLDEEVCRSVGQPPNTRSESFSQTPVPTENSIQRFSTQCNIVTFSSPIWLGLTFIFFMSLISRPLPPDGIFGRDSTKLGTSFRCAEP
jgi:hypothetical protein